MKLYLSLDPNDRKWACITMYGGQVTFMSKGDMYAMAAEYASYVTRGAITFIRKNGEVAPILQDWSPEKWPEENQVIAKELYFIAKELSYESDIYRAIVAKALKIPYSSVTRNQRDKVKSVISPWLDKSDAGELMIRLAKAVLLNDSNVLLSN